MPVYHPNIFINKIFEFLNKISRQCKHFALWLNGYEYVYIISCNLEAHKITSTDKNLYIVQTNLGTVAFGKRPDEIILLYGVYTLSSINLFRYPVVTTNYNYIRVGFKFRKFKICQR